MWQFRGHRRAGGKLDRFRPSRPSGQRARSRAPTSGSGWAGHVPWSRPLVAPCSCCCLCLYVIETENGHVSSPRAASDPCVLPASCRTDPSRRHHPLGANPGLSGAPRLHGPAVRARGRVSLQPPQSRGRAGSDREARPGSRSFCPASRRGALRYPSSQIEQLHLEETGLRATGRHRPRPGPAAVAGYERVHPPANCTSGPSAGSPRPPGPTALPDLPRRHFWWFLFRLSYF